MQGAHRLFANLPAPQLPLGESLRTSTFLLHSHPRSESSQSDSGPGSKTWDQPQAILGRQ